MRYKAEHKDETRRRILEAASRRFKQHGIDGSGIATLMKDAGLTNGAFYAHFDSKDDLVAGTLADQLAKQCVDLHALEPGRAGAERFVRDYLSREHRDHPEEGCPTAALIDEVGRSAAKVKTAFTEGAMAVIDEFARRIAPEDPASARVKTLGVFAALVGTLEFARAVTDRDLSDQVLDQGVANVLMLMDA
jgi:AcrR family transcriptional regulator